MNVVLFAKRRSLSARGALVYLAKVAESHPESTVEVESITHLGTLLGWERPRTSKQLKAWETSGKVTVDRSVPDKLVIRILPSRDDLERAGTPLRRTPMPKGKRAAKHASGPKRASEPATDHANPATGTQAMANAASENVPGSMPNGMSQTRPSGTPNSTPQTAPSDMPSHRSSGHANRDVVHRPEDLNWRLAGSGGGGDGDVLGGRHAPFMVVAAYLTALALALIAAWFSVRGMVVLFPGDPVSARALGVGLEVGKIVSVGFMAAFWRRLGWGLRIALFVLFCGCEFLNASGVFGQLVIAHLHKNAVAEATFERSDAEANSRIEVAQGRLTDLDRRIAQIDGAVEGAASRGRSKAAMDAMRSQRQQRGELATERDKAQRELASLKVSRSSGSAQRKVDEAETAPVVWAARTIGIESDPEVIIRFIIAVVVMCLDPLALALMAAVNSLNARRQRWGDA
jgi:hypothetical protein